MVGTFDEKRDTPRIRAGWIEELYTSGQSDNQEKLRWRAGGPFRRPRHLV